MGMLEFAVTFAAFWAALLFTYWIPRRLHLLSNGTLKLIFRTVGLHFLLTGFVLLATEWGYIGEEKAVDLMMFGIASVGCIVTVYGGSDAFTWWYLRQHRDSDR